MIVDDESDISLLFKLHLEELGYQVDVFNHPLMALDKFEFGKYKLAILDVKMPHMNGFELYTRLKEIDSNCKFCFTTAFETYYESLKEFFPTLDISCFLRKPVTKKKFMDRIAAELG